MDRGFILHSRHALMQHPQNIVMQLLGLSLNTHVATNHTTPPQAAKKAHTVHSQVTVA